MKGREAGKIAELASNGWELTAQSSGLLRTELTFRKAQPESLQAKLVAGFQAIAPATRRKIVIATAGLATAVVLLIVILSVASGGEDSQDQMANDENNQAADLETAPDETASSEPTPTSTPTTAPEPSETQIPYTYQGPEYEVVIVDPKVGLGKIDQYWVLTDTFDYSTDNYKKKIKMIISDLARQEGTESLIVNVVTDELIIEAESTSPKLQQSMAEKGPDYFTDVVLPTEKSDWAASYTGGIDYDTGQLSDDDSAFEVLWRPYATSELEDFKPKIE